MNVAIIGGTGFVGRYLVAALLEHGHKPSLLVRPGSAHKVLRAGECRLTEGDLESANALEAALTGCDAVIYNVGILREQPRRGVTFKALQYEGVVRTLEAARKTGVRRVLLMSANGVKLPGTTYQETKYRAERAVEGSGLDYTIFQPSVIFGDPQGAMEFATQLHRDMVKPPVPAIAFYSGWRPATGAIVMSPVHVRDVAEAFVAALEDAGTSGKTFVLGGPDVLSWTDMLERIATASDRRKMIVPVPIALMSLGATLLDWLPFFPVTKDQLKMLEEGNTASPGALRELIGKEPQRFVPENLSYLSTQA